MTQPAQRPGRSVQEVRTPPEFLDAVRSLLAIDAFSIDLAAGHDSCVVSRYLSEDLDSLTYPWAACLGVGQWAWLHPPFAYIEPWVEQALHEKAHLANYAGIAMLVPAVVGSNWWRDFVHQHCHVHFLNGRLPQPYPKDCALLLYSHTAAPGYTVWDWKGR